MVWVLDVVEKHVALVIACKTYIRFYFGVLFEEKMYGKLHMKETRLKINLTQVWVCHHIHDTFIQQWMSTPGK